MRWMTLTLAVMLTVGCSKTEKTSPPAASESAKAAATTPPATPSPTPTPSAAKKAPDIKVEEGDGRHEDDDVLAQLVGIWRVDLGALAKDPTITKLADKDRAEALALMRQTFQPMAFEYAADGKLRIFLGSQVRAGTYRIDDSKDGGVSLTTVLGTGAGKIESKSTLTFVNGGLVVAEEGQTTLRLVRGIPAPPGAAPPQ